MVPLRKGGLSACLFKFQQNGTVLVLLPEVWLRPLLCVPVSSKTKGPGEKGAPRNHPEISSQKLADLDCRFPYDSYGRDRAPVWPFLGEEFWGNIRRPLVLPAPLFYCWSWKTSSAKLGCEQLFLWSSDKLGLSHTQCGQALCQGQAEKLGKLYLYHSPLGPGCHQSGPTKGR